MTVPEGAPLRSSPDSPYSSAETDRPIRANRSNKLDRHVVDLEDADRVLECAQVQRQLRFQHRVRHYLSQLLHGCTNPNCDTRTCLSNNRRLSPRPLRPPTQLTARALAYYLASHQDAEEGLCPYELRVPPSAFEIEGAVGTNLQQMKDGDSQYSTYPAAWRLLQPSRMSVHGTTSHLPARAVGNSDMHKGVVDAVKERRQAKKDTKSLAQCLFDNVTMIYSYSKQLPTTSTVFDALRSSNAQSRSTTLMPSSRSSNRILSQSSIQTQSTSQFGPSSNRTNDQIAQPARQNSGTHSHSYTPQSTPEISSNGQRIHKIPYNLVPPKSPARIRQASRESTNESPKMSISKTGRKNFTLGGVPCAANSSNRNWTIPTALERPENPPSQARSKLPVLPSLNCNTLEDLKDEVYYHRKELTPDNLNFSIEHDAHRCFRPSKPFVNRSLFYSLSDPETLLKSFHENNAAFNASPLPHLDSARLASSFRDWTQRNGALIFDSLWIAIEALFVPPPELTLPKTTRSSPNYTSKHPPRYLNNLEAAHIAMVCIHALTSHVSIGRPHTWAQVRKLRSWGVVIPVAPPKVDAYHNPYLQIIDELEYEPAVRLAGRLLCGLGARMCFERILATMPSQKDQDGKVDDEDPKGSIVNIIVQHLSIAEHVCLKNKQKMNSGFRSRDDPGWTITATLIEWLKTVIMKNWDSKVIIKTWSNVGAAFMLLSSLHASQSSLNVRSNMFEMPVLNERVDAVEEPFKFLDWEPQPNNLHIFQHPELFPDLNLVTYFRTINFTSMLAQYNDTTRAQQMQRSLEMFLQGPHKFFIKKRMKVTMNEYLVLEISRENALKNTLDDLWGLEKRMLQKPLKVLLGKDEGEVGLDHGGVTYEFFRVVLSEAFRPDYGMFTQDARSRMTWFQPNSLEPDWKFEMIGVLFSLAVYNGITLPVTLPLALYHYLLPSEAPLRARGVRPDSLDFIKDGWPELAKSFEQLLSWTDGDVGDAMMVDYAFNYEAFGQRIDHNMSEHYIRPEDVLTTKNSEPKLVTNKNREEFVRDYIHHLTVLSVEPQIQAFRRGFLACLQPKSLHLFSPITLRSLIEGSQNISIPDLRRITHYEEGYSATHPAISMFWDIVEQFNQDDCRHLLEFVTASDRVPVTGYDGIIFSIVRYGGEGEVDRLPTSSTCFGKLYLPEYKGKTWMKEKLLLAIRNSRGFGNI